MSEEEIIKQIKNDLNVGEFYGITEDAIKGLLDLYNKQKELIEECDSGEVITENQMRWVEDNFISKDKIRDKIKELKECRMICKTENVYTLFCSEIILLNELLLEEEQ